MRVNEDGGAVKLGARVIEVLLLALLSGCASLSSAALDSEAVTARASERWVKLVAGDLDGAYAYHSPGSRAVTSLESYKATVNKGFWRGAKVDSAECAADVCKVTVTVDYVYRRARALKHQGQTKVEENWVKEDQTWWYVPK